MLKRKTIYFLSVFLCLVAAWGFYSGNNGNNPNADAPQNNGLSVQMQGNYNPGQGDVLAPAWTSGASEPTGTTFNQYCTYARNDTAWLYVWGNTPPTAIAQRYNVNTNVWTTVAANPTIVDRGASCSLKDSIYIAGGYNGSGTVINTFQKYDVNSNTWTTRANLPAVTGWGKILSYQDSLIYLAGGFDGSSVAYATVYVYNSLNNTWRACTSMPGGRFGGGFALAGDTLVYCGGADASLYYNTTYKGVISQSNRATITWTTGATMPAPYNAGVYRTDAGSWGCKGIIMCNGSTTSSFTPTNGCMSYSPGLNTWTVLPNKPNASLYCALGTVKYTGNRWKLVTAGGYNGAFMTNVDILSDTLCPVALPNLCEDFTSTTFPPTNWTTVYTGTLYWTRQTVSGYGVGTGSARFNAYSAASGTTQSLITMQFVPTVSNQAIIFDLAFRPYPATAPYRQDSLIILSSTDNGTTFTSLARYGPLTMATAPPSTGQFTPAASEWQKVTLLLPTNTNKISFVGYSDFGQDIFIDSTCVGPYVVGIANNNTGVPKTYSLSQNYPNPFNPTTDIKFALPKAGLVKMVVYDILGRIVETPVNEYKEAGTYTINFNAASLASGVYFYRVTANEFVDTKKMLLVK